MRISLLLGFFLLPAAVFAQDTKVFHVNGVWTTLDGGSTNLQSLQSKLGTTYRDQNLTYVLAYNQTEGHLQDVLDVFSQKIAEYKQLHPNSTPETNTSLISKITAGIIGLPSTVLSKSEVEKLQADTIQKDINSSPYLDVDSENIRKTIETNITSGQNVFIVAHSQGTLYANIVYDKLIANSAVTQDKIKLLSIADVAAYMPNGDWISSVVDPVVALVKASLSAMPYNAYEWLNVGHSLIDTYLKEGSELLTIFTQKAQALLDTFTHVLFDGKIKVTFYNAALEKPFINIPWVMDSKGNQLWELLYSIDNYQEGNNEVYEITLPLNKDINDTYVADWVFNDVNITTGMIECGDSKKTVAIAKNSTNHFGVIHIVKIDGGYECRVE